MSLEDAGFVPKGEIGPFYESTDTTYKGEFPVNTDGGQLSGGQPGLAGGFRHVIEGARQVMGKAGVRQVPKKQLMYGERLRGHGERNVLAGPRVRGCDLTRGQARAFRLFEKQGWSIR